MTEDEIDAIPKGFPREEPRTLRSMMGAGKGGYASPEEAVAFIRAERDAWE